MAKDEKLDKIKLLESTVKEIQDKYGEGAIMKLGEARKVDVDVIPTGAFALDAALGVGGAASPLSPSRDSRAFQNDYRPAMAHRRGAIAHRSESLLGYSYLCDLKRNSGSRPCVRASYRAGARAFGQS